MAGDLEVSCHFPLQQSVVGRIKGVEVKNTDALLLCLKEQIASISLLRRGRRRGRKSEQRVSDIDGRERVRGGLMGGDGGGGQRGKERKRTS